MLNFIQKLMYRFNSIFNDLVWLLIIGCAPFFITLLMMAMVQNLAPGSVYAPGPVILLLPFLMLFSWWYLIAMALFLFLFLFLFFYDFLANEPSSIPAGYRVKIMPTLFKLTLVLGALGGAISFILWFKNLIG